MKTIFLREVVIARPRSDVWAALVQWDQAHRWMKGVDSLHAQGLTAPGTVIVFHARGKQMESTIRACDTGRRIVLSSTQGRVRADYEYTLEDHPDGTRVRLHAQCDMGGFVRLFGPLVRLAIRLSDGDQLEALKAAAEGRPSNL